MSSDVITPALGANADTDFLLDVSTSDEQATEVTRDRLYIDAIETVLGNTTKVMISVEGGNNIMYLPLDKLVQGGGGSTAGVSQDSIRNIADSIVRELNDRISSGRVRDTR